MRNEQNNPEMSSRGVDPLSILLLVMTVTTGLLDAVSFLGLGKVFTANMTGNVVFLGFALGGAQEISVASSMAAIGAFLLGAAIGGRLGNLYVGEERRKWLLLTASLESSLLVFAGLASVGFDFETHPGAFPLYAVIALTSAAMGIRNATVRRISVKDLTTTVLTLTLTGIGADSGFAGGRNENLARRAGSVILMLAGAAIGAWLLYRSAGVALPLFVCGACVLLATLIYFAHPASKLEGT